MKVPKFLIGFVILVVIGFVVMAVFGIGKAKPAPAEPMFDMQGREIKRSPAEIKMNEALARKDRVWMVVHDDSATSKRVLQVAERLAKREKFTLVSVDANAQENHELMHRMPVPSLPTSVFVNRVGAPVMSVEGAISEAKAREGLSKANSKVIPPGLAPSDGHGGHSHGA